MSIGWHTVDTARASAPTMLTGDDAYLQDLLDVARIQCEAYAPALAAEETAPANYLLAQVMQARNLLNAQQSDPSSTSDGELFIIRPYPMDNVVKNLLRPATILGAVG
jgi:hypothetical protein